MKTWVLTLGLGAAIGAVAILLMPHDNPTRKLADQAADKVEDVACKLRNKLNTTGTLH